MSSLFSLAIAWLNDFHRATVFLTRLPLPQAPTDRDSGPSAGQLARALRCGGLTGALVGSLGGGVYALMWWCGLPPLVSALIAVATTILITGALHEDGLADLADGLGGGWTRDRKLQIMRDSRIGAYGTLALIFSVGIRAAAIAAIGAPGSVVLAMISAHGLARAWLVSVMWKVPLASQDGLAAAARKPDGRHVVQSLAIAFAVALLCLPLPIGLGAVAVSGLGVWLLAWLAKRQIGGYSGDVLGAAEQCGEMAVLLLLVVLLE